MATVSGDGDGRGSKKVNGKWRTPKLSEAQKRANKLARSLIPKAAKTIKSTPGGAIPF